MTRLENHVVSEINRTVDVNQFYVLKSDMIKREAIRKGTYGAREGKSASDGSQMGATESGPLGDGKDLSDGKTSLNSQKRKHQLDMIPSNSLSNRPIKLEKPNFESAKVKKLQGNPNKVKKKKKNKNR